IDRDRVKSLNRSNTVEINRYIAFLDNARDNRHSYRPTGGLGAGCRLGARGIHSITGGVLMIKKIPDTSHKEEADEEKKPSQTSHNRLSRVGIDKSWPYCVINVVISSPLIRSAFQMSS